MNNEFIYSFVFKGDIIAVSINGGIFMWKMHPVTGEYNWYHIGTIMDPFR
jgi:hypothetical protein